MYSNGIVLFYQRQASLMIVKQEYNTKYSGGSNFIDNNTILLQTTQAHSGGSDNDEVVHYIWHFANICYTFNSFGGWQVYLVCIDELYIHDSVTLTLSDSRD